MPHRHPIAAAESVFRDLGGFPEGADRTPATGEVLAAIERFAPVEFEVAGRPESDGFLFQYATLQVTDEFVVGFARQFVEPEPEDVDCYVQLLCEYHLAPEPDLAAAGHRADWWFRDGPEPFGTWFGRVTADPVWRLVDGRSAGRFAIYLDAL